LAYWSLRLRRKLQCTRPSCVQGRPRQTDHYRSFPRRSHMSRPLCHCLRRHQSYADLAACWNPRAAWVSGSGAYAVITDCTPSPMIALCWTFRSSAVPRSTGTSMPNTTLVYAAPGCRVHAARQVSGRYARTLCGLHTVRRDQWRRDELAVDCRTCLRLADVAPSPCG
jgi:hypothetical protein